MTQPKFTIQRDHRTQGNSIRSRDLEKLSKLLANDGFVILPSDTCYSLAAFATSETIYKKINIILNRKKEPISIAFPNFSAAKRFAKFDFYTRGLLEKFTPGPITVVCKVLSNDSSIQRMVDVVRSVDGTVGVRIPDSSIEREVAGCTYNPITTVAIRDAHGTIAQDLGKAIEIVKQGISKLDTPVSFAAIQGDDFLDQHSTVIRVDGDQLTLIRPGQIDFEKIHETFNDYPTL